MTDTMLNGDPRRYGYTTNHFIAKETLTLPVGKTIDEMIQQWLSEGKLERVHDGQKWINFAGSGSIRNLQRLANHPSRPCILGNDMSKQKTFWAVKPFCKINHLWVKRYCAGWSQGDVSACGLKESDTLTNIRGPKCKNCLRAIKNWDGDRQDPTWNMLFTSGTTRGWLRSRDHIAQGFSLITPWIRQWLRAGSRMATRLRLSSGTPMFRQCGILLKTVRSRDSYLQISASPFPDRPAVW